jgi:hypothetical protein
MEPSALMLATESGLVETVSPTNSAAERRTLFPFGPASPSFTVNMAELAARRKVGKNTASPARRGFLKKKRTVPIPIGNLNVAMLSGSGHAGNCQVGYGGFSASVG